MENMEEKRRKEHLKKLANDMYGFAWQPPLTVPLSKEKEKEETFATQSDQDFESLYPGLLKMLKKEEKEQKEQTQTETNFEQEVKEEVKEDFESLTKQEILRKLIEERKKIKVLYADTDSVYVQKLDSKLDECD